MTPDALLHSLKFDNKIVCYHIKTGNPYVIQGSAINCTNAQEDQSMIIYHSLLGNPNLIFVRELSEFCEKFSLTPIKDA